MALKFLNKKGWHTGSLRNIENVWKAEQKHEAEQRKLEELRKQIHEERERAEFRQLQEQAGLIPKQERLDFLYDSGLAVGKGSSSFKALESLPKTEPDAAASSSAAEKQPAVPGALFEEKSQSANDSWRKLHSDPLLLIRQREQEALARVKNNPVQMAIIRKSVEAKKDKDKDEKKQKKNHHRRKSKHRKHSSSENESDYDDAALTVEKQRESRHKSSKSNKPSSKRTHTSDDDETSEDDARRKKYYEKEQKDRRPSGHRNTKYDDKSDDRHKSKKSYHDSQPKEYSSERHEKRSHIDSSGKPPRNEPNNRHRKAVNISEEERAARLREMQMDAEIHEQQRWKRLKKAADSEDQEAIHDRASIGRNFLDAAQKSVYGAEKGGSKSIEESVRRRMHYSQGRSASDSNAFRRS